MYVKLHQWIKLSISHIYVCIYNFKEIDNFIHTDI